MGIKPSDAFTISLCRECHHMAHTMGDDALCLDMMGLAREFYFKSPHRSKLDNPYA